MVTRWTRKSRRRLKRPGSEDPDARRPGRKVCHRRRQDRTEEKGHGGEAAKKANAKAAKEGKRNPRKSSAAQSELGKKGGKAASKS